jgi:drug/metabolite transporter (DMT)-like permease
VQFWAQKLVLPRYVALIYTLEPVGAMLFAVLHGDQQLTLLKTVGASLILAASTLSVVYSGRD